MTQPRILISEPNAAGEFYATLPYVWAVLKSYWEHYGSQRDAFQWMDPIFRRPTVAEALKKYASSPPDILGLSCYTWNWDLQCDIARWAKQLNPHCLVMAGGPDPDYKDPNFFRKHPYIDLIVVKDGEIPFNAILETYLRGGRDFQHIPGLYMPCGDSSLRLAGSSPHLYTGAAQVPKLFDYSPYVEQTELYERILAVEGKGRMNATWETNRGCPYSCSFCDWGSATMSKVRNFEMSRVEAEADWLGRMGVFFLYLADANFGILPRDVDIAELIASAKTKHRYPTLFYYSPAKNNPDRTVEIARRTYGAGLTGRHTLAVQHTDAGVLAATERSNISPVKYREVLSALNQLKIGVDVQLIIGIPGDTPDKWKACLCELMDWGAHDKFYMFPNSMLPNAPAAEPQFREKWQIETIDCFLIPYPGTYSKTDVALTKTNVVVASRTFTRAEWAEMSTYSAFIRAFHNRAFTRLPALYLHFVHGVSYRQFYDALIDEFSRETPSVGPIYERVRTMYANLSVMPGAWDRMTVDQFPEFPFFVESARWIAVNLCLRVDEFYGALAEFLCKRFPRATHLRSAIEYQKNLVLLPDYVARTGKTFPLDRDWPDFFRMAGALTHHQRLEEPAELPFPSIAEARAVDLYDGISPFDFGNGTVEDRWTRFLAQVITRGNSCESGVLSQVQIRPALAGHRNDAPHEIVAEWQA